MVWLQTTLQIYSIHRFKNIYPQCTALEPKDSFRDCLTGIAHPEKNISVIIYSPSRRSQPVCLFPKTQTDKS